MDTFTVTPKWGVLQGLVVLYPFFTEGKKQTLQVFEFDCHQVLDNVSCLLGSQINKKMPTLLLIYVGEEQKMRFIVLISYLNQQLMVPIATKLF